VAGGKWGNWRGRICENENGTKMEGFMVDLADIADVLIVYSDKVFEGKLD